jgi:hypothetical protein
LEWLTLTQLFVDELCATKKSMDRNQLKQCYDEGDRNFQKAELSGVDLSGLDLREADFRGADLYGTKLMDSLLCRADFSGGANLEYANLRGADLSEANLSGANLAGASLDGAIAQGAIYDPKTVFPVGFDIKAAGGIDVQELERQSRIASVNQLKTQAAQPKVPDPEPVIEPEPIVEPPQTIFTAQTPVSTAYSNPDDSSMLFPPTRITEPSSIAAPPQKQSNSWLGVAFGMLFVLGLGFGAMNLVKPSSQSQTNPFESVQYPQPACGDPLPTNDSAFPVDLYPVFVNDSSGALATVKANFCRDAFVTTRKDSGIQSVQVASFSSQQRAAQFAQFMQQKVGSGDVGTPTQIFKKN